MVKLASDSCRGKHPWLPSERATPYIGPRTVRLTTRWLHLMIVLFGGTMISEPTPAAEPGNKVRIGYPSSAVSTLPFDIAKEKGFFTKAGLDVEYIQMRSALGPQAILNGNI